ncbi:biliverdin-producing heme oxygenase [Dyadobacter aurulentus]|uniref:biliverdin-producing heme oxygenase n=1 Tax=Dyadobacter sp. UC 10 TaxID=2605428 RepID=UPI0011F19701|nr:biliverdin-producing heme oxygenase [Dyadobacter sp. UC 10]KAA0989902.1 biliverdin-producing heme oxygenase [Dyadobacter sp. UC 10]
MSEVSVFEMAQESFIKTLRKETAESHQNLEDNPLSKALLDPDVTLADYQAYLSKLYGVTVVCEKQVFPELASVLPDLSERYKAHLIEKDLLATGLTDAQIQALPVHHFHFSRRSEAIGIMYVLEGSTLGGKIIYKHIHEKLGFTPESGAAYFWGYGTQTGTLWKSFVSILTQFAAENNDDPLVIESAKKTFTEINKWLSGRNC